MTFENPHIILMALAFPIAATAALIWAIAKYQAVKLDWEEWEDYKRRRSHGAGEKP